jgi:hypothetical protein
MPTSGLNVIVKPFFVTKSRLKNLCGRELPHSEQFLDSAFVGTRYKTKLSKISLPLGGLLSQDVAVEGVSSLDLA